LVGNLREKRWGDGRLKVLLGFAGERVGRGGWLLLVGDVGEADAACECCGRVVVAVVVVMVRTGLGCEAVRL